jgi:asparagine synthetase B (glutamine-hydrolysing)
MATRLDLLSYILANLGDRQEMSNSIEGRTPFLDRDVVQVAAALKPTELVSGLNEKSLLKKIAAQYLPADRAKAPKHAFFAPNLYLESERAKEFVQHYTETAKQALPQIDFKKIEYWLRDSGASASDGARLFLASSGLLVDKIAEPVIPLPAQYPPLTVRVAGLFRSSEVQNVAQL